MKPALRLDSLAVRDIRNLARVDIEPAPRFNAIWGNNGQGKTSLLEAIYLVATSRSFRTSRAAEVVRHGADVASVRARFVEAQPPGAALAPIARDQLATVSPPRGSGRGAGAVRVKIDENRPATLAEYATRSPIVVFHADELTLSSGPASSRRTLLDRLALFMDPSSADHRGRYARALRARHLLLRGASSDERGDVAAFETLCARHGAALTRARRAAAAELEPELLAAFRSIGAPGLELAVRYAPGGAEDDAQALAELERHRARDAHRPTAGFGPHRDDLVLTLDGHEARVVASQGQHRALTLALKAAEAATVTRVRGVEPILLLDDVSSELDPERNDALFAFLALARGQIFLTTTRPELLSTSLADPADRRDFLVSDGAVEVARKDAQRLP